MNKKPEIPAALKERIKAVKNMRARLVLRLIAKNGKCSTRDIEKLGYKHPPRARQDAKDLGFAIKTVNTRGSDGKIVAEYFFDERELDPNKTGRVLMPKKERDALIKRKGSCCNLCGATTNLQIDHRIPYEVAGESQKDEDDPYQVVDGICNRRKSWACEHCENLLKHRKFETCLSCYWASPENYTHVAMRPERRIDIVWTGGDVNAFEAVKTAAAKNGRSVAEQIKVMLTPRP